MNKKIKAIKKDFDATIERNEKSCIPQSESYFKLIEIIKQLFELLKNKSEL